MRVGIENGAIFEDRDVVGTCVGFDCGSLSRFRVPAMDASVATGTAIEVTVGCECDAVGLTCVAIEERFFAGPCIDPEQLLAGRR